LNDSSAKKAERSEFFGAGGGKGTQIETVFLPRERGKRRGIHSGVRQLEEKREKEIERGFFLFLQLRSREKGGARDTDLPRMRAHEKKKKRLLVGVLHLNLPVDRGDN